MNHQVNHISPAIKPLSNIREYVSEIPWEDESNRSFYNLSVDVIVMPLGLLENINEIRKKRSKQRYSNYFDLLDVILKALFIKVLRELLNFWEY